MRIGLIDVIDWQTTVDFRDGRPLEVDRPPARMAARILREYPYAGDLEDAAVRWVTDVALEVDASYRPQFIFLDYAHAFFSAVFRPQNAAARVDSIGRVFEQIARFVKRSGFTPVIVGLGDLVPVAGYIDTTGLECHVSAGGMTARYAGLYGATPRDLEHMAAHEGVERVVSREAFRAQCGGSDAFYARFPDHLLVAREGYVFRGVGSSARPLYTIPGSDPQVPLHAPGDGPQGIDGVADFVLQRLAHERVALILVEGVGCETFPLPFRPISNEFHGYCYAVGEGQYATLTTGRHFVERPYPPGYRFYLDDDEHKPYPFSGIFTELPEGTIGQRFEGRSAAVGDRGILTHAVAGADVVIECFVRALYNHGVMAVLDV